MKKKTSAAIIIAAISTSFLPVASQAATNTLDEIIVEGDRDHEITQQLPGGYENKSGSVGILGTKDIMETPFQQNNISQKSISTFAANPSEQSTSVLVNVPAVRTAGNTLYNDFSIRGQNANAYQFRINGIPGLLTQTNIPMNMIESVDVISGPGLGVTGVQAKESAGGVINLITKRAGAKDIMDYTTFFSGRSTWGNMIDISRRFADNAWGIRINTAYINGDTAIRDEKETQKNFSINIDHQTDHSFTNIFLGYRDTHTERAERYYDFSSNALTGIPSAPDSSNNYAFKGQQLGMRTWMAAVNHVQSLDDTFKVFINAGYAYNNGYDYRVDASSRVNVINDAGDFTRSMVNEPFAIRNKYIQIGANKIFNTGAVKNDLVVSFDKDWYEARWSASPAIKGTVTGNLYTGQVGYDFMTEKGTRAQYSGDTQFFGWTIADTLSYRKWDVTLGAHKHTARVYSASSKTKTVTDAVSPLFAIVYKPSRNWSVFGSHSESFDQGTIVGNAYANKGDILDPAKTKSNELGIKYTNGNIITELSYFDTKQDSKLESEFNGNTYLRMNGETRYRGIQLSLSGKISPKWTLSGGFMYLNSEYKKNSTPYYNGKSVIGTPDWSAVLTAEYTPNEAWDIWGRMIYTGSAPVYNHERTFRIDSSTVFDLGIRYRSRLGTKPVDYNLTVFNLFDKNYWMPRATYAYGILSNPRAFCFSATVHF